MDKNSETDSEAEARLLLDFISVYVIGLLWVLLTVPRKIGSRILETLFPVIRRPL